MIGTDANTLYPSKFIFTSSFNSLVFNMHLQQFQGSHHVVLHRIF